MEIVRVENLSKIYQKDSIKVVALDNVSLSIEKGDFVAIVGTSGSGKSTLMHLLGGVDVPTSGQVYIDGTEIYKLNDKNLAKFRSEKIGLIYQFYNLLPVLTVEENIKLPFLLSKKGKWKKSDQERLDILLNGMGLEGRSKHLPSELSGGQQQRVSIARALINNPAVILADEPTGNLDSKNSKKIIDILRKCNTELNQTIIIVTHDANIAKQASRVIVISDGKIIRDERRLER